VRAAVILIYTFQVQHTGSPSKDPRQEHRRTGFAGLLVLLP
jgi:hypothetical protein